MDELRSVVLERRRAKCVLCLTGPLIAHHQRSRCDMPPGPALEGENEAPGRYCTAVVGVARECISGAINDAWYKLTSGQRMITVSRQ